MLCPLCKVEKPTDEFHNDASRANGLSQHCKSCVAERVRGVVISKSFDGVTGHLVELIMNDETLFAALQAATRTRLGRPQHEGDAGPEDGEWYEAMNQSTNDLLNAVRRYIKGLYS